MNTSDLIHYCYQHGLLSAGATKMTPLAGGVSSDIVLVESEGRRFVLKQSLAKLQVEDDWYCDPSRNITEYRALRYAAQLFPQSVPKLILGDVDKKLFIMEYLGEGYVTWKSQLLKGDVDFKIGEKVAIVLATLHEKTWNNAGVRKLFDTGEAFYALRIEPYLLSTGRRHPELNDIMRAEGQRLIATRQALVHGDWSPKNILVSTDRIVVLDWEVAWFGDPAFDSAFFLNLLYLKSLYNRAQLADYLELARTFRGCYGANLPHWDEALERRICRLTQMLLLARIDGKSPAEYITNQVDKILVREFIREALLDNLVHFDELDRRWAEKLNSG